MNLETLIKIVPLWVAIVGMVISGGVWLREDAVSKENIRRDLVQIQCRIGMAEILSEEDRRRCVLIKPFIEDVEDILEEKENGVHEET